MVGQIVRKGQPEGAAGIERRQETARVTSGLPRGLTIAVDGPSAAGKSVVSKALAVRLGLDYVDTGAMYRAVTLKVLRERVDLEDAATLPRLLARTEITVSETPSGPCVILDGRDVTQLIRAQRVTDQVAQIASLKVVRQWLVKEQRRLLRGKKIILSGRDIGTVVCPAADRKFYLDAALTERTQRRHLEQLQHGGRLSAAEVRTEIMERDRADRTRAVGPLRMASDAVYIDSTNRTVKEVVELMVQHLS